MDFRLAAADAPESDQPFGQEATRELSQLIRDKQLVLGPTDTDRYGRTVVFAWADGLCVNKEMVRRGAAWFYSEYSNDAELFETENEARHQKRGAVGVGEGEEEGAVGVEASME